MFSMPSFCTIWIMVMMIASLQMHGYRSCIESERKGLLDIKAYLNNSKSSYDWPNNTNSDCCKWERVKCDLTTERVISLSLKPTIDLLPLNLSLFFPFGELQILNITSFQCAYWFDDIHGYKSLGKLKKLEVLDFSSTSVNNSVLSFLNAASSLKTLVLRGNSVEGIFPMKELKNLRNLELLDLSRNEFIGPLPDLAKFHKLQSLDLSDNEFSGSLETKGLCQLKKLRELDMSKNKFIGQFPECFDSLTQLHVLDISSNQLNGTLPSLLSNFTSIEYLSLSDNEFEGFFSFELIANLSKLKVFKLSSKSTLLQIETDISLQPKFQLSVIELQNCNLEKVPSFLQQQKDLRLINLSHNKLSGVFPSWFLVQYPKLEVLLLQNNSFTIFQLPRLVHSLKVLDVSANKFDGQLPENIGNIFPNLGHLNLSSNTFYGNLPSSSGEMNMLHYMDVSRNNLSGNLPKEFLMGCNSLRFLKLSYNSFTGQIFSEPANLGSLMFLMGDNNQFSKISNGLLHSNSLSVLDLTNNYLRGGIPSWLGGFSLMYLLVSNNLLEGTIPSTLFNIGYITLMDLSRNKLSGNLPTHFNCYPAGMLFLNENEFSGEIPHTLLENIMVLDLRNNKFSGKIPRFVNTKNIQYLLLRGNRLTGHIPTYLCDLSSIKILDLAKNRLSGFIPSCFTNMSFGRTVDNYDGDGYTTSITYTYDSGLGSYFESSLVLPREFDPYYFSYLEFIFEFVSKSRYESYTESSVDFMFGLDLSNNELSGIIPKELGDLQRLRALNLSHNSISGLIPKSFSNLKDIESLDLSFNMLHGPIPHDLTKLHYMVVFNVSYNNMSGSIPSQGKFSTLDETNYIANPFLCGLPLDKSCDNDTDPEQDYQGGDEETTIDMEVFYWSLAVTYSITWMTFIVFLCFDSPWRRSWFRFVDAFISLFKCV